MSPFLTAHKRRKRRASRGQALIESAFFFLILVTMVAASYDTTSLLDNHLNVVYASRQGARTGAVLGQTTVADCAIIKAVQAALTGTQGLTINSIIIYQSQSDGSALTTAEDKYAGNTTCTLPTNAGCSQPNNTPTYSPAALASSFQPCSRNITPFSQDSIGVEVDYSYTFQFALVGVGTLSASDHAVEPMEVVVD